MPTRLRQLLDAAPIVLDLALFMDLAHRAGASGVQEWLSFYLKAPQAAGVIHTDFEKGFIRAEIVGYEDYVAGNGEQGAKEAGKWRLEGKDYITLDGDVMHFRFNV